MAHWNRRALLALIAGLAFAACDHSPTLLDPRVDAAAAISANGLTRVYAPGQLEEAEALVGPLGGTLAINGGAIRLIVPPGAVLSKTRFAMRRTSTAYAQVELTATSLSSPQNVNDVGARGFAVPVQLHISYADTGTDPSFTVVAEETSHGELRAVQTALDLSLLQVVGLLPHFSGYVMASN